MTQDEQAAEIGGAIREYSENKGKIACLDRRLVACAQALKAFCDNPDNSEAQEAMNALRSDPREDAAELLKLRAAQSRLREFFRDQNLDIA